LLKDYQDHSKKAIKIHYAFIKGENDSLDDLEDICTYVYRHDLNVEFNLVRYNPASTEQGEESSQETIDRNISFLRRNLSGKVQIIPRVGVDVAASCGCFVDTLGSVNY
jgi:adenine C2-methylase RlmN of 23S rRNA A2503 and tRNA A37